MDYYFLFTITCQPRGVVRQNVRLRHWQSALRLLGISILIMAVLGAVHVENALIVKVHQFSRGFEW